MITLTNLYIMLANWLPIEVIRMIGGLMAILMVMVVFRLIKLVLDALPFL